MKDGHGQRLVVLRPIESVVQVEEVPSEITRQITASVDDILSRMRCHEERFRTLAQKSIAGVMIGVIAAQIPAIELSSAQIAGIGKLGVDLQFDLILAAAS